MQNRKLIKKIVTFAVALVMLLSSCTALAGCSLFSELFGNDEKISFSRSGITMQVGETYDVSKLVETESRYSLTSSDKSIVTVSGYTIGAVSAGYAYVRAETSSDYAELLVTVVEPEADSLSIIAEGELIQSFGAYSAVTFKSVVTGTAAASGVKWYVNGSHKATRAAGEGYSCTPSGVGVYEIKAVCAGLTATSQIRVYYPVEATVTCTGELEQSSPLAPVTFGVEVDSQVVNPPDWLEFYCDGELLFGGEADSYEYTPTVGRHTLSVRVNGKQVYTADGVFRGSITPPAPTVEFDNTYPHFYINYDVGGAQAAVEVRDTSGSVVIYNQTDPRYAALFDGARFDAGNIVQACSSSLTRTGTYRFRVKSLGDGDALFESEFSDSGTFTQLTSAAKKYRETIVLDRDLVITSPKEFAEITEYYVFFRSKTGTNAKVSYSVYVGYDMVGNENDLWQDAFPVAATSGRYTNISVKKSGNIINVSFTVSTINDPSKEATGERTEQLHALLPHINYDESKYRAQNYVFAIDARTRSTSVTYSDELFLAAQGNTRPEPVAGSKAEIIYNAAKNVLRRICTDDMTDIQKAHAIYDWVMWQVAYDTPATQTTYNGEALSAYYLEGVFGNGEINIGGMRYNSYAVCDGISKAYALMCNMEGIPCVRVVGEAGDSVSAAGGHAWNKVFVNGGWYVVDCTWGDLQSSVNITGKSKMYELGLHDYLFLTDAQVAGNHFEPYKTGSTELVYAPVSATERYSVYANMEYNGTPINCYISGEQNKLTRAREIATAYARAYTKKTSVTVPGGANGGVYPVTYQGFDFFVEGGLKITENAQINSAVTFAIKEVLPRATVKTTVVSNVVVVLVKT